MKNNLGYIREIWCAKTQAQLARISGVPRQTISDIERKNRNPSVEIALKLAKSLHVKVEDIFILD